MRIVVLGDSLSAGLGLAASDALPAKLERALQAKGIPARIENAGVSGDTAAGGLARLDWSVAEGHRRRDPRTRRQRCAARQRSEADPRGARSNHPAAEGAHASRYCSPGCWRRAISGPDYAKAFDPIYPELAAAHDAILYPFILDGVAGDRALNQADGMHPTAAGVDVIVARMLPKVEELVARVKAGRAVLKIRADTSPVLIGMAKSGHDLAMIRGGCRPRCTTE